MRFATPALTGALRAANPTYRMATQVRKKKKTRR
jgi:hypothetical protein